VATEPLCHSPENVDREQAVQRDDYVRSRTERWERLETLVKKARKRGLRRLTGTEVLELAELYRLATSDLAIARRDFPGDRVSAYLNGLLGRAHPHVYQESGKDFRRVARFVVYGYPATWRASSRYIGLAFGLFLAAAIVSAALVSWRQSMADILMPGDAQRLRGYMEQHQLWMQGATSNHPWAANFIMLNNIQVAFVAFAGGILFGLLTVYEMVQNGIMLGTTGAMIAHYGLSSPFWSFVLPHGVIELSVIFTAGGAGLILGDAILRPGQRRRQDAIPDAARIAVRLLVGCVPLLMIAGTIEGFYSPSNAPDAAKFAVGITSGVVLYTYLLCSRPRVRPERYTFTAALSL